MASSLAATPSETDASKVQAWATAKQELDKLTGQKKPEVNNELNQYPPVQNWYGANYNNPCLFGLYPNYYGGNYGYPQQYGSQYMQPPGFMHHNNNLSQPPPPPGDDSCFKEDVSINVFSPQKQKEKTESGSAIDDELVSYGYQPLSNSMMSPYMMQNGNNNDGGGNHYNQMDNTQETPQGVRFTLQKRNINNKNPLNNNQRGRGRKRNSRFSPLQPNKGPSPFIHFVPAKDNAFNSNVANSDNKQSTGLLNCLNSHLTKNKTSPTNTAESYIPLDNNYRKADNFNRNRRKRGERQRSRSRSRSPSSGLFAKNRRRRRSSSDSRSSDSSFGDDKSDTSSRGALSSRIGSSVAFQVNNNLKNKMKPNNKKKNKNKNKNKFVPNAIVTAEQAEQLKKRAARFDNPGQKRKEPTMQFTIKNDMASYEENDFDWESMAIVGKCHTVEKAYFRLTSAPDSSTIRPLEVLKEAFTMVKEHWKKNADYKFACDQLKSIRQDMTVQCIRDKFSIDVYEAHARIALENNDHEEFNQCQTQLADLYPQFGGKNRLEFLAYLILYHIFTRNSLETIKIIASLRPSDKLDPILSFSLKMSHAWLLGNYHAFFKLFRDSPSMSGFVLDWSVKRERRLAIRSILKAYVYLIKRKNDIDKDFNNLR